MRKSAVIAVGLALAGCGGEAVDLGDNGEQVSLEGEWVGSLESYLFVTTVEIPPDSGVVAPPSSKPLRLRLDSFDQGSLLVGETALPPPTDPNIGYPPEAQLDAAEASGMIVHLYDGINYPLINVSRSGKSLHVEFDALQAFDALCGLQVPVLWWDDRYGCLGNLAFGVDREAGQKSCWTQNPDTGETKTVDCIVMSLCVGHGSGCVCTASECHAGSRDSLDAYQVSFDLELNEARTALAGGYIFWGEDPHPQGDPQIPAQRLELWRQ